MATSEILHPQRLVYSDIGRTLPAAAAAPVRVCFLIDELGVAGTETQLVALIRHLDRARVQPYLCLLRGNRSASQALEPVDCPVLRLGVGSLARPKTVVAALRFHGFLRRERIDVLQVYFPDSTYFGIPLGWLAGVPSRIRTQNNQGHWLTPTHRRLGRVLNRFATHTLANCAAARDAVPTDQTPGPCGMVVLENGVDIERFAQVGPVQGKSDGEELVVGAVANLRAVKGLDVLIDAAKRLVVLFPKLRFRVAGEGEARPALEQLIRDYGLADRFELLGAVHDVPAFLADLDVAVLCSRAEGMPNAVLEYMAAGRPIVATAVGAVADLIEHKVHGLVVPPGEVDRLAAAIGRLLRMPKLARSLGEAARERVQRCYSRAAMVRRFETFYLGLARRQPQSRDTVANGAGS